MSRLHAIQQAAGNLSQADLQRLQQWLIDLCDESFDRQIAADIAAGKYDESARQAVADYYAGLTSPL